MSKKLLMTSYLRFQEEMNKYKSDLYVSMKSKYKLPEKMTALTYSDHLKLFDDLYQRIKSNSVTNENITIELFDYALIAPQISEEDVAKFDTMPFITLIREIQSDELTKSLFIALAIYFLEQKHTITEKILNMLFKAYPILKDSILKMYTSLNIIIKPNIADTDLIQAFDSCIEGIHFVISALRNIPNVQFYFHSCKFIASLINAVSYQSEKMQRLVTEKCTRILCYNPFAFFFLFEEKSFNLSISDLPPLSVILEINQKIPYGMIISYAPYVQDFILSFLCSLPFKQDSEAEKQLEIANRCLHALALSESARDLYLMIFRHFVKAPILRDYFNNARKLVFSNSSIALRQAYVTLFIAAFQYCQTPVFYELIKDCRDILNKFFQFASMLFVEGTITERTKQICALLQENKKQFDLLRPSHYIMLNTNDNEVQSYLPYIFQELAKNITPRTFESYFIFVVNYFIKYQPENIDVSFALEILSTMEHFDERISYANKFALYLEIVRNIMLPKIIPAEFIFFCRHELYPRVVPGALSLSLVLLRNKNPDFIAYCKANRDLMADLILNSMTSELPCIFYLCYEIMKYFVDDTVQLLYIVEKFIKSPQTNSRKSYRVLLLFAFIPGFNKLTPVMKNLETIVETLKNEFSKDLGFYFLMRFFAINSPKNSLQYITRLIENFSKFPDDMKYCIKRIIEDIIQITGQKDLSVNKQLLAEIMEFKINGFQKAQLDTLIGWEDPYGPSVWIKSIFGHAYL